MPTLAAAQDIITETRAKVADFVGVPTERVSLLPNFSWGMNAIAGGLDAKRDRVLLLERDYPSLTWPVEDRLPQVERLPPGPDVEDRVWERLRLGGITVFCISLVQWLDGRKFSLEALREIKRDFKELLIIADGTQYLGTAPFQLKGSGIDVLGCSGYKWLLAGYGNGFFAYSDFACERLNPQVIGNGSTFFKSGAREEISLNRKLEPGHLDPINIGSLGFSMGYLLDWGLENIGAHLDRLAGATWAMLEEIAPEAVRGKEAMDWGSIYWFPAEYRLFEALTASGVHCSWRGEGIRMSWHLYNTLEDVERLSKAVLSFR